MARWVVLLVALIPACKRYASSSGPAGPQEGDDPGESAAAPPDDSPTRVRVTAAEAAAHGLPAIGFSFDTLDTPIQGGTFAEGNVTLWLSGPPGGVQTITVQGIAERVDDAATIERIVRASRPEERVGPLTAGEPTEVELAGSRRTALPFVCGRSMARTSGCAIAVPDPSGAAGGLLIQVAVGDTERGPSCAVPLGNDALARVLATFRLE